MSLGWIVLPSGWSRSRLIFLISSLCPHVIGSLYRWMLTLASEEVANPQLAKDNLIIVLNFITNQLFLAVDERF